MATHDQSGQARWTAAMDQLLWLAGLEVDAAERDRLARTFAHYRAGIELLYAVEVPGATRPYLVTDVDASVLVTHREPGEATTESD